jgi:hypothetical protein
LNGEPRRLVEGPFSWEGGDFGGARPARACGSGIGGGSGQVTNDVWIQGS